jgi:hypothetical protein
VEIIDARSSRRVRRRRQGRSTERHSGG